MKHRPERVCPPSVLTARDECRAAGTRVLDGRRGPTPGDAMKMIAGYPALMGISRMADITGLDRLGIPVIQAVRPLALSNTVSQGKGCDHESAALSAILESAETFLAEQVSNFDAFPATADELGIADHSFKKHLLPYVSPEWRQTKLPWVRASDLIADEPGWLPLELVHTAFVHPPLASDGIFCGSTTGLAVALDESDAILHGIFECIERDAIARAHRIHGFFQRFRIDVGTIDDPGTTDLIDDIRRRGLEVGLWIIEGAGGVPAIWCQLMEDGTQPLITPYPADGFAASLDPCSAVQQAVREAAQSRLAAISGARDDITRANYPRYTDWQRIESHRHLLANGPRSVDFGQLCESTLPSPTDWFGTVLHRLSGGGVSSALIVNIDTRPLNKLYGVRVVLPQLEPFAEEQ